MRINMAMEDAVYYGEESVGRGGRRRQIAIDDPDDDDDVTSCSACCKKCCACFKSSILTILIFLGIGTGIAIGVVLRYVPPFDQPKLHPREMMYLFYPVELFIRLTMFLTVPLVVTSLISGAGSLSATASGKIGLKTLVYYLCTSILAVGEGLGFVYAIRPGSRSIERELVLDGDNNDMSGAAVIRETNPIDTVLDMLRNTIPDNIVTSLLYVQKTKISIISVDAPNGTAMNVESFGFDRTEAVNLPGLTFLSILFGLALAKMGDRGRLAHWLFDGVCEAILTIIRGVLWLFPIVSIFSMAHLVINMVDPVSQMLRMFMFSLTVLLGLFTHMFLLLPIIYVICTRRNPFRHLYYVFRALLTGFTTNNSTVTLPVTMDCLDKAGVNPRIVRWMCPIGATINMDGFAIYEAMACVFIATMRGLDFAADQIAILGFMTVALSIGAPTSGGGIALFIVLFKTLGLPIQDIFILLPFDWMLARFRTVVNIWGDCVGAGIVDKCSRADLDAAGNDPEADDRNCMGFDNSADGAVLTGYGKRKDWTVRLVNPYGDRMVVSKV